MALFTVERYLGDEEEELQTSPVKASDILKKLQDEAKARRKSAGKEISGQKSRKHEPVIDEKLDSIDVEKEERKSEKKKKRKHKAIENSDSDNEETEGKIRRKQNQKKISSKDAKSDSKTVENTRKEENEKIAQSHDDSDDESDSESETDKKTLSEKAGSSEEEAESESDMKQGSQQKTKEIGGFTVIGDIRPSKLEKVKRVLPDWLSNPSVVSGNLKSCLLPVADMPGLDKDLIQKLTENNIHTFFPVQMQVIPTLLETCASGFHTGRAGYRPSDICVSAPTGSGKTLAFVLPVVQALKSRVRCEVRALAVLPVRELATQVFKVFQTYCHGTNLKVGLLVGQKPFAAEQQTLVTKRLRGYQSQYDIVVATPGRLVDHINKTEGFTLAHLRYLVMDEADRMMDEVRQDWLQQVETAIHRTRPQPRPLTSRHSSFMDLPLQKLLYSATLSQNPEKLQQLNLFQPKLFTSVVPVKEENTPSKQGEITIDGQIGKQDKQDGTQSTPRTGDFVGKYTTPAGLKEYSIETTSNNRPLMLLHLLHHLKYRNILCFTNSLETTHRLYLLLKLVGGVEVREFSSGLHGAQRNRILQKFAAGKIDIIICTDAMARGMDISNVKYVVSYDMPGYIQTYIHRIGRTARAGKEGTAFTFLQEKEFFFFKKMVKESGKQKVVDMKVPKTELKPLQEKYQLALKQLPETLQAEKEKKKQRKTNRSGDSKKTKPDT